MSGTPRAFDPQRLLAPLRANAKACVAAAVVALFAGAAIARLAIPNERHATAAVHLPHAPHEIVGAAKHDDLLARARDRAGYPGPASALRERLVVRFAAPDRFAFTLRGDGDDEKSLRALTDALAEVYVERANARTQHGAYAAATQEERARVELARRAESSEAALHRALVAEGHPELDAALAAARAERVAAEREAANATAEAAAAQARLPLDTPAAQPSRSRSEAELAAAQRELSRVLAEHGSGHPAVAAAQQRLDRLQQPVASLGAAALKQKLEVEALAARARELTERLRSKLEELERLEAVREKLEPLYRAAESAREELEAPKPLAVGERLAVVSERARVTEIDRRGARLLASLLTPLIALLSLFGVVALRELRGFRVRSPSELAYWLDAPVLAASCWPHKNDALELLVDELADPALAARGVTLLLPLSELERPLANTLAAQLNARAQRHYRSTTGSRITIAQPWMGELASPRIRRAAEAADRVLWVVAADAHRGPSIRERSHFIGPLQGVAAVLVDADAPAPAVGSATGFWIPRSSGASELHAARVASN